MRQGTSKKCPRGANCVCVCIHGSKEICSILCIANLAIEKKERERKTALAESQAT